MISQLITWWLYAGLASGTLIAAWGIWRTTRQLHHPTTGLPRDLIRVADNDLHPGQLVMVAPGWAIAADHGRSAILCVAKIIKPGRPGWWWLDVAVSPGVAPIRSLYGTDELLGVPSAPIRPLATIDLRDGGRA